MPDCPSSDELVAFHTGELAPGRMKDVSGHIEHCHLCEERLQFLDGMTDPVLALLRRGISAVQSEPSLTPFPAIPHPSNGDAEEAVAVITYDFLEKSEDPEELGRLGTYRVLSLLGRGGMGVVLRAEDLQLRRAVALKVLPPALGGGDLDARQRFLREARATAALRNDHIVTIYQVGQHNDVPYLAMELLRGETLEAWLARGGGATLAEVLRIGREIVQGLVAAHDAGLIHRDIKPANIWLEERSRSDPPRVKILDFGLARVATEDIRLTKTGYIVGTPAYMAPEQARSDPVDARADLFSLGCVLYRLATGRMAFPGETTMAVLIALAVDEPVNVAVMNPQLPPSLCRLIEWLLAKNPADRPASAEVVLDALQSIERECFTQVLSVAVAQVPVAVTSDHGTEELSVITPPGTPRIQPAAATAIPLVTGSTAVKPTTPRLPFRLQWLLAGVALACLVAIVLGLLIPSRVGVLVLEGSDDAAALLRERTIRVQHRDTGQETALSSRTMSLPPGDYEIQVRDDAGIRIDPAIFSITSGHKTVLQVSSRSSRPRPDPDGSLKDWIAATASLKGKPLAKAVQDKLKEKNPDFQGPFEPTFDGDSIVTLVIDAKAIRDLTPLRALRKLSVLYASSSDRSAAGLADLTPLAGMAITELTLKQTRVTNLESVGDLPALTKLDLERTPVSDLRPLKRCRKLELLIIGDTGVKELTGVESLPLKLLAVERTKIADLSPIASMKLGHLNCSFTPVKSLAPIREMRLEYLACFDTQIDDFTPLKDMPLMFLSGPLVVGRDGPILRGIPTLKTVNNIPVDEFLKKK